MKNTADENSYLYEVAEYLTGNRGMDEWSHAFKNRDRVDALKAAIEVAENKAAERVLREFEEKYPDLNARNREDHNKVVQAFADFVDKSLSPKTRIMDLGEVVSHPDHEKK